MDEKNSNLIKTTNLNILRCVLRKIKSATKPQLSEMTGISVVTINSLIKSLMKNNEVIEDTCVHVGMGRPAVTYKFNPEHKLALVIYMHESKDRDVTYCAVCNLYGEEIDTVELIVPITGCTCFDVIIESKLKEYPNIQIIALGLPVEEVNGTIMVSDYEQLLNSQLRTYLEQRFPCDIIIENDINIATFGYAYLQNKLKDQSIVGLYYPNSYPPGAGICMDGKIIKGRDGMAGEIKYLPLGVNWDGSKVENLDEVILKTIQIFLCLYNPSEIIVYCEKTTVDFSHKLLESAVREVEKTMIPKIVLSRELNNDYKTGIIQLALKCLTF